ncbi:energy transducer TonB [Flavitalea sp. BT771]|uniref:energy transducer TonB n=1 Tax=Flavitalea sp. BT771 TaxID=3063329 RepID=UPI0026E26242|nr:energy transducer TonB [Flavitalea sp. BT771]MDO6429116.1 energy transducer TonB [Flavitalea sp. BT771]MDV6218756.1 energy transducer TonB [Flavitalea sp. BT771]
MLTKFFVIGAISMGALTACSDNAGDKTSDKTPATTDSTATTNAGGTSSYDSASKKAIAKKKGRATVAMSESNKNDKMVADKEGVYNKATVMPEFPGGQNALATYVNNHVEYPQQAIDDNTAGTVRVSFVVDEHGKVQQAKVINGQKVGNGLDEEALRVVNNMPAWKPGKVKGHNVKTRLELPINFQLEA